MTWSKRYQGPDNRQYCRCRWWRRPSRRPPGINSNFGWSTYVWIVHMILLKIFVALHILKYWFTLVAPLILASRKATVVFLQIWRKEKLTKKKAFLILPLWRQTFQTHWSSLPSHWRRQHCFYSWWSRRRRWRPWCRTPWRRRPRPPRRTCPRPSRWSKLPRLLSRLPYRLESTWQWRASRYVIFMIFICWEKDLRGRSIENV